MWRSRIILCGFISMWLLISSDLTTNLISHLPFSNGSNIDVINSRTITTSGVTSTVDRFGLLNSARHFTKSSYISISNSPSLDVGTNDFSISVWFKRDRESFTGTGRILSKGVTTCNTPGFILQLKTSKVTAGFSCGSGCILMDSVSTFSSIQQWYHVVYTVQRNIAATLYVNGQRDNSSAIAPLCSTSSAGHNWLFGLYNVNGVGGNEQFYGTFDDVRIYNRALSVSEIRSLHVLDMSDGLVAYFPFNGNAIDASGSALNTTVSGATLTADRYGASNSAYHFTTSSYIQVAKADVLEMGTGDFTMSAWVKRENTANFQRILSHGYMTCANPGYGLMFANDGRASYGYWCDNPCELVSNSTKTQFTKLNIWSLITVTVKRSESMTVYVNGVLENTHLAPVLPCDVSNSATDFFIGVFQPGSDQFYGDIDDVRIYNRTLSTTEVRALYFVEQPYGLIAYFSFNGNANDMSGYGHTTSVVGATLTTDRNGNSNSAYHFTSGSYISISSSVLLNIGINDFTLSAWIRLSAIGTVMRIFSHGHSGCDGPGYMFQIETSGVVRAGYTCRNGCSTLSSVTFTPFNINEWHLLTVTFQRGVLVTYYVDGVNVRQHECSIACDFSSDVPSYIGGTGVSSSFLGDIDDVRIYNIALTAAEVQALYYVDQPSSQPTRQPSGQPSVQPSRQPSRQPSSQPSATTGRGLIAYFPFENYANDASDSARAVTVSGATLASDRFGVVNAAYSFAASGHYIQVTNTPPLEIGTGDFSISLWVKRSGGLGQNQRLVGHGAGDCVAQAGFVIYFQQNSDRLVVSYTCGGVCSPLISNTVFSALGVWYHVACSVRRGVIGNLHVNGQLDNTLVAPPSCDASNVAAAVYLGVYNVVGHEQFYGVLDDVRIYNRALSVTEIRSLYVLDMSDGLVAYFPFNGNAIDASGSALNTTVSGATLTADRHGNANSAYLFTANSYIQIAYDSILEFGTGDFSISAWVMRTSTNGGSNGIIFIHGSLQCTTKLYYFTINYQNIVEGGFTCGNCEGRTYGSTLSDVNVWHLITLTVARNVAIKVYIDGVLDKTLNNPSACDASDPSQAFYIGSNGASNLHQFLGAIDDVRVYNRAITADEVKALMFVSQPSSQPSRQPSGQPSRQPSKQPTSRPSATTGRGLIAYFPFENNANDASDSARAVTVSGATLASDRFGVANAAYNFAAAGHYIQVTNTPLLEIGSGDFSISMWVRRSSLGQTQRLISHGIDSCSVAGFLALLQQPSNRLEVAFVCDGQCRTLVSNAIFTTLGVWYHFAYSVQRGVIGNLYINGQLDNTLVAPPSCDASNVAAPIHLGTFSTAGYQQFYGTLDDVRVYNRALSVTEIRSLYVLDMSDGLVAYFPFNGNAIDASGSALNTTVSGATLTADRHGNANSAYLFTANSYIQIAYDSVLEFGTGDFSISAWVKRSSISGAHNAIFVHGTIQCSNKVYYLMINNGGSYVEGGFSCVNCEGRTYGRALTDLNVWHLITLTVARNVVIKVYVDGVLDNTLNNPSACDASVPSQAFYIGSHGASNQHQFLGAIDDVRVYNRAITADEVKALMLVSQPSSQPSRQPSGQPSAQPSRQPSIQPSRQPTAQPSVQPTSQPVTILSGLVAYFPFSGNALDSSGNGIITAVVGATLTQDRYGSANKAYHFGAQGQHIKIMYNDVLKYGTGDFTLSVWVKREALGSFERILSYGIPDCSTKGYSLMFEATTNDVSGKFACTTCYQVMSATKFTTVGVWHHLVWTTTYGSDMKIYVNGHLESTVAFTPTCDTTSGSIIFVGAMDASGSQQFIGDIDELRIYNRALTASEARALYFVDQPVTGLVAYFPFTGNANDMSGRGHVTTVVGATLTADRFGNPNSAYNFVANSYIAVAQSTLLNMGTGDFTVSAWVKFTTTSTYRRIFTTGIWGTCGSASTVGYALLLYDNNRMYGGGSCLGVCESTGGQSASFVSTINVWHMLTFASQRGVSSKLYINGVLDVSRGAQMCSLTSTYSSFLIGAANTAGVEQFYGDIDEVRIYNKALTGPEVLALYTESPTSQPSRQPTSQPSRQPSRQPSSQPTKIFIPKPLFSQVAVVYGVAGSTTYNGENVAVTSAGLGNPTGISGLNDGTLFVEEHSACRTRRIDPVSKLVTTLCGTGAASGAGASVANTIGDGGKATSATTRNGYQLFADTTTNKLYLADLLNNRARVTDLSTNIITTVAGTGYTAFNNDIIAATGANLNKVVGVCVGSDNIIYVGELDGARIRRVDSDGIISTLIGTGTSGSNTDSGTATSVQINLPHQLYADSSNRLFFAELGSKKVRKIDLTNNIVTLFAGNGAISPTTDGMYATSTGIKSPKGVYGDLDGYIYVMEHDPPRLWRVDPKNIIYTVSAAGSMNLASLLFIRADSIGHVYFTDSGNSKVKVVYDISPTSQPSNQPSSQPSGQPSGQPSRQPTGQPSRRPTTVYQANGLIAYFPFNGNANDMSGYGHTTSVVGATLVADRFNAPDRAYHFTANSRISITNSILLNIGTSDFTVSVWIKPDSIGAYKRIFSHGSYSNCVNPGYVLALNPSGKAFVEYSCNSSPCTYTSGFGNTAIPVSEWTFVTLSVVRGSGSQTKIYVNEQLDVMLASAAVCDISSNLNGYIGSYGTDNEDQFLGAIDEVRVYNRALTQGEVIDQYNADKTSKQPSLLPSCQPYRPSSQPSRQPSSQPITPPSSTINSAKFTTKYAAKFKTKYTTFRSTKCTAIHSTE